ncbi:MAG: hypothetical protein KDD11_12505, partial [Acidobacteria bacterium]|nr:hypothetical protein [Acidobacteriota bacterium]
EAFDGVDLVFFCGPLADNRRALDALPEGVAAVLLCPDASPADAPPVVAGINLARTAGERRVLSPHPGAVMAALLLHPLVDLGLEDAVVTLIQPASMHDQAGIDELFDQTRRILAFADPPDNEIFRRQLAFNLLPARRPVAHLAPVVASLLGGTARVAVEALQGGFFHGTAASVYLRFTTDPGAEAIREALADAPHLAAADEEELLGPIDSAARDEVLVGEVRSGDAASGGYWLWGVMDNLTRGGAVNALAVARELLGRD